MRTIDTYYDHYPTNPDVEECKDHAAALGVVKRVYRLRNHSDHLTWVVRIDYEPHPAKVQR